jgi:membrane protein YqaA with SNARE-associated domain
MEVWADSHWGLWGLFLSSFVSATLAPGGSEIVLVYLLGVGKEPDWLLWLVATSGNTIGGLSSWVVGFLVSQGYWSPEQVLAAEKNQKVLVFLNRWGVSALLLSWMPVVGDLLCLLAGWLKLSVLASTVAMFAGKGARYAVVIHLQSWIGRAMIDTIG